MGKIDKQQLVRAAARARERAVAPYSKFKVGAALLAKNGEIISGANVESASYGLTCCAERVALFNALTSGKKNFVAVAVVARAPGGKEQKVQGDALPRGGAVVRTRRDPLRSAGGAGEAEDKGCHRDVERTADEVARAPSKCGPDHDGS